MQAIEFAQWASAVSPHRPAGADPACYRLPATNPLTVPVTVKVKS